MSRKKLLWLTGFAAVTILTALVAFSFSCNAESAERWYEAMRQGKQVELQLESGWLKISADGVDGQSLIGPSYQQLDFDNVVVRDVKGKKGRLVFDKPTNCVTIWVQFDEDEQGIDGTTITRELRPTLSSLPVAGSNHASSNPQAMSR